VPVVLFQLATSSVCDRLRPPSRTSQAPAAMAAAQNRIDTAQTRTLLFSESTGTRVRAAQDRNGTDEMGTTAVHQRACTGIEPTRHALSSSSRATESSEFR
jgi:hypothetical protein